MTLATPDWLHLLWGLPLLVLVAVWAARARRRDLTALFSMGVLAGRVPAGLERRRAWTTTLALLGLALVALAAAQPRWGFSWRELRSEGVEIVLVLDVSWSMDAEDVEPSRLERGRREILDLLQLLPTDRVGLIIFAAGAYPRVPLTLDHDALERIVRNTDSGTIQAQGSAIGAALEESVSLFSDDGEADRAVVLLSDGELWDEDLSEAVDLLRAGEVRVYSLGIGTEGGAPIPLSSGGFKKDGGSVVLTQLQEEGLKRVASSTGGTYLRSVAGAQDVRALADRIHGELAASVTTVKRDKIWDERFQWPLAGGLGLLLLGTLLGDGRMRRSTAGLLLVGMLAAGPARADALADAQQQLAEGQTSQAVDALTRLQVERPGDPGVAWSLGEALFQSGRYDDAARVFTDLADRAPDTEHSLGSRYNSGLSHYGAGRLEEAVRDWDRVLEQDPDNVAAKQNADAVRQELAHRQQQPPPEDQEGGEEGEPSEGGDTGQPQEAEPSDTGGTSEGEQSEAQEAADAEPGDDGTREAEAGEAEEGEPEGDVRPVAEAGDTATPEEAGEPVEGLQALSEEEAARLLESVDEGTPRVTVRGRSEGKDW